MSGETTMDLKQHIREVPDFPKPGILFYDITTLLGNPDAFRHTIDILAERYGDQGIDAVVAIESRGFIFGGALADRLRCSFVPVRKPGKLPWKVHSATYELEYGSDTLCIHEDAVEGKKKVIVLDDLLATGGTAAATGKLVRECGAEVAEFAFVVELTFLNGRQKLKGENVFSILQYDE
jgi:adenine phosphoribosyltransferase